MKPDIEEARAIQRHVELSKGDLWGPYDSGRYAYHTDILFADNPYTSPPDLNDRNATAWARGWLHEQAKE